MFDHTTAGFGHGVAAARMAALRRSAEPVPAGPLRAALDAAVARGP